MNDQMDLARKQLLLAWEQVGLSEEERETILGFNLIKGFEKGEFLLRAGEKPEASYLVLAGCLRSYSLKEGEEHTADFFLEGGYFSPPATDQTFLVCMEDSVLFVTTPKIEEVVFERFPRFERMCRISSAQMIS